MAGNAPVAVASPPQDLSTSTSTLTRQETSEPETLTDDQIFALLDEAEQRMTGKTSSGQDESSRAPTKAKLPSLGPVKVSDLYVRDDGKVASFDSPKVVSEKEKKLAETLRPVEPVPLDGKPKKTTKPTAGQDWFNLPQTEVTPELKRDLQLLRMRNVLDPHRHYKKDSSKGKIPEYSQVGTVVEGPTEFFSSRIPKKDRKKSFLDEVLADQENKNRFKRKYGEIQDKRRSGKKDYYKKVMKKRGKDAKF